MNGINKRKIEMKLYLVPFLALFSTNILASNNIVINQATVDLCVSCHSTNGEVVAPGFPNLSGQSPRYLKDTLMAYKAGTRQGDAMPPIMDFVSEKDIEQLSKLWVKVPDSKIDSTYDRNMWAFGRAIYNYSGAVTCENCHEDAMGDSGSGMMRATPRLRGQNYEYLYTTLEQYKAGNMQHGLTGMKRTVKMLSEAEIKAVATYLTSLDDK